MLRRKYQSNPIHNICSLIIYWALKIKQQQWFHKTQQGYQNFPRKRNQKNKNSQKTCMSNWWNPSEIMLSHNSLMVFLFKATIFTITNCLHINSLSSSYLLFCQLLISHFLDQMQLVCHLPVVISILW